MNRRKSWIAAAGIISCALFAAACGTDKNYSEPQGTAEADAISETAAVFEEAVIFETDAEGGTTEVEENSQIDSTSLTDQDKEKLNMGKTEFRYEQESDERQDLECYNIDYADLSGQTVIPLLFEDVSVDDISYQQNKEGENFSFVHEETDWQGISGVHMLYVWRETDTGEGETVKPKTSDEELVEQWTAQQETSDEQTAQQWTTEQETSDEQTAQQWTTEQETSDEQIAEQRSSELGISDLKISAREVEEMVQEVISRLPYSFGEPEISGENGTINFTYPVKAGEREVAGNILYTCPYSNAVDFLNGEYITVTVDGSGIQSIGLYDLREETGISREIKADEMISAPEALEKLESAFAGQGMIMDISEVKLIYLRMLKQGGEYAEELIPAWRIKGSGVMAFEGETIEYGEWTIESLVDALNGVVYLQ